MDVIGSEPEPAPRTVARSALRAAVRRWVLGGTSAPPDRPDAPWLAESAHGAAGHPDVLDTTGGDPAFGPPPDRGLPTMSGDALIYGGPDGGAPSDGAPNGATGSTGSTGSSGSTGGTTAGEIADGRTSPDPGEPAHPMTPAARRRRILASAAGIVVAATAVLALRAGTEPVDPYDVADAATVPIVTSAPNVYGRARLQPPPFDRLPGRTPIPNPSVDPADRRAVAGRLPAVGDGTPTALNADTAARLVLGRYCRRPWSYDVATDPVDPAWRQVRARVTRAATSTRSRVFIDLRLRWDAATRTYAWSGAVAQLDTCS